MRIFLDGNPLTELKGAKDKKIAKGFKEVNYIFVLTNLELFNEQMKSFIYILESSNLLFIMKKKILTRMI